VVGGPDCSPACQNEQFDRECLESFDFHYFLTGRVNQDCVENLFSMVRLKKPLPTPLDFVYSLKQICVSQFLYVPSTTSYHIDDSDYFTDLFALTDEQKPAPDSIAEEVDVDDFVLDTDAHVELPRVQQNILYHLSGYCVHSVIKSQKHCECCFTSVLRSDEQEIVPDTLTNLREYTKGSLLHVSKALFSMILKVECMFRQQICSISSHENVKCDLIRISTSLCDDVLFPTCHDIKTKIISKFINVRLRIYANKRSKDILEGKSKDAFASKSVAMRALANDYKT
jgi:hypothetical protein